jgi:hypothetical protein
VTVLSPEKVLVYVLAESGVRGHLTAGRIERGVQGSGGAGGLDVFDAQGNRIDYLSGRRIRSWCLVDTLGRPLDGDKDGWREILPEDLPNLFPDGFSSTL